MGGSNSTPADKQHVVVIGGSFAGTSVGAELEKKGLKVTIIEPRDSVFISFAGGRAMVAPGFEKRMFVPMDRVFRRPGNSILPAFVTGVDPTSKTVSYRLVGAEATSTPSTLSYDFLVIATGSTYSSPFKVAATSSAEARAEIVALQKQVAAANDIVVVGGGPVGAEVAGEVRAAFPKKNVTLIHRSALLLSAKDAGTGLGEKVKISTRQRLEGLGVKVLTNASVDVNAPIPEGVKKIDRGLFVGKQEIKITPNGTPKTPLPASVPADLVIYSVGPVANTGFLRGGPLEKYLEEKTGRVKVDLTYLVKGLPVEAGIFSLGDVCNSPDAKSAWVFQSIAPLIAENIARLAAVMKRTKAAKAQGKSVSAPNVTLKQGKPDGLNNMGVMALGPNEGVGQTPFGVVGRNLVSAIKGKDLFTGMFAGNLGYKIDEVISRNA